MKYGFSPLLCTHIRYPFPDPAFPLRRFAELFPGVQNSFKLRQYVTTTKLRYASTAHERRMCWVCYFQGKNKRQEERKEADSGLSRAQTLASLQPERGAISVARPTASGGREQTRRERRRKEAEEGKLRFTSPSVISNKDHVKI